MLRSTLTAMTLLLAGGSALAADATADGKALFESRCAACHAAGPHHAGTMKLALVRGADHAVLAERKDLVPEYVRIVVRHGLIEMPPWRQTELDDASLEQIVAYLTRQR